MEVIFVVEDDENIRNLIGVALEGFGYQVEAFETAEAALERFAVETPSLMIFDWMLPGMDGVTAIGKVRKEAAGKNLPILMLTAKDKELDKVKGLDSGADDYMVKPFGILELAARIRSLLRRNQKEEKEELFTCGTISLNPRTRKVKSAGEKLELTLKEYELLYYLMSNTSRVVPRNELLDRIWGYDYDGGTRTLDMHIRMLRQKLGDENGAMIKTVRGVGYRLADREE